MRIAVIDGKGGGLGRTIVESLKPLLVPEMNSWCWNEFHATAHMLKEAHRRRHRGNAIVTMAGRGPHRWPIAIIAADAMMERSPRQCGGHLQEPPRYLVAWGGADHGGPAPTSP